MFLQNRVFSDTETLLEVLFDLELGDPAPELKSLYADAEKTLAGNTGFQKALASLEEEEDRLERADEAKRESVAELLQARYGSFKVENKQFFGMPAAGSPQLLASIDLV